MAAVRMHQALVVCGATGSGKTTQLPQLLLQAGLGKNRIIGHTQPRRIAARSVAQRIASEMGQQLGELVGVQVRFDDNTSSRTRIKLMTDGIALAELVGDPLLTRYDAMIVDEAHERTLNIDLLLASLRLVLRKRPEFRVIITSATIDPARLSNYFGGAASCPVIEVSGRSFPIRTIYHPPSSCADGELASPAEVADAVEEAQLQLATGARAAGTSGSSMPMDVLVFVPGERELRACSAAIAARSTGAEVLPLFARLSTSEQDRVFASSLRPRVIVATNVAETSLTLPAIGAVVDTGVARISRYDAQRRVGTLPVEAISKASCDQRAGRCGRIAPGVCIRLFSEASYRARSALTAPEVQRTNLAGLVLRVRTLPEAMLEEPCAFSGLPVSLLDAPSRDAIDEACQTLFELQAATSPGTDASITSIGKALARMPLDPRVGRMLLAARGLACESEVLILAAGLSVQDPRERPQGKQEEAYRAQSIFRHATSDFLTLLKLYDQFDYAAREGKGDAFVGTAHDWCRRHFVNHARMREWRDLVQQLRDVLEEVHEQHALHDQRELDAQTTNLAMPGEEAIHRALLTGLIATVACREGDASAGVFRSVRGEQAKIFPGSALFRASPQWIMAGEIVQTSQLFARTVARIDVQWIKDQAGHLFRTVVSDPHVDSNGEPVAWSRVTLGSIVVTPRERTRLAGLDPVLAREVFIEQVLACADVFAGSDTTPASNASSLASHAFMRHNAHMLRTAALAQAKLRRRDVIAPARARAVYFEGVLPQAVCDQHTLLTALAADAELATKLRLSEADCLTPLAARALDEALFPSTIALAKGVFASVSYAFAAGKDDDGITITLPLLALPSLTDERAEWLVPGMHAELFAALLKSLPKGQRAEVERAGVVAGANTIEGVAQQLAELVENATSGAPRDGVRQTLANLLQDVLGVRVEAPAFAVAGLATHLKPRVVVLASDQDDTQLASGRDITQLRQRLSAKLAAAQREQRSLANDQAGMTTWDNLDLRQDNAEEGGFLALVDESTSVRLTRVHNAAEAAATTQLGVRRLLAIACADDLDHYIQSVSELPTLIKQYAALGSAAELRDAIALHAVDRAMLFQQSVPETHEEFEQRLLEGQGKLMPALRDVTECLTRTLEARARVAHRLGSGTNRMWATSIADIREHAAYLMPQGFLHSVTWQRLRDYPRYAETMRARLFALREDGSGVEKEVLALVQPRWKLLTAWAARTMSKERAREEEAARSSDPVGDNASSVATGKDVLSKGAAPRHQARRGAPVVNVDAGVFAMKPHVACKIEAGRWLLEDLRAAVFGGLSQSGAAQATATQLATQHAKLLAKVDEAWARIGNERLGMLG